MTNTISSSERSAAGPAASTNFSYDYFRRTATFARKALLCTNLVLSLVFAATVYPSSSFAALPILHRVLELGLFQRRLELVPALLNKVVAHSTRLVNLDHW